MTPTTDWDAWHDGYADPGSLLSERLRVVQAHIEQWLEATAPTSVRVLSLCAGDGRDLLGVLASRPDAHRVVATLLEADRRLAGRATAEVDRLGLSHVEVRCTDASLTDACTDACPADLLLLCGIFGNVSDRDVRRTIAAAPQLCAAGARVIWTRHRREPDLTARMREWWDAEGFTEERFVAPAHGIYSVGVHRFGGVPQALQPGRRLFTFTR
jgi:hypothetical protein